MMIDLFALRSDEDAKASGTVEDETAGTPESV